MKKLLSVLMLILLTNCFSSQKIISEAKIYKKIPGLEGMKIVNILSFQIVIKKPSILVNDILETTTNKVFNIQTILDEDNFIKQNEAILEPGSYRIIANNPDAHIKISETFKFMLMLNKNSYYFNPLKVNDVFMK